ncbi:MAG: hypothetical protein HY578_06740 [Nitrospinae bacterium]|nr:hypothetical protein [Nitrospinota bacterium]
MARILPKEVTSLIHHITLNQEGWWDKTIQRLILSTLWAAKENKATKKEILLFLHENFQINVSEDRILREIEKLLSSKAILKVDKLNDEYKISEAELKNFNNDIKRFEEMEAEAKNTFEKIVNEECNAEEIAVLTWDTFHNELLIPLLYELGAKTYELITGKELTLESNQKFKKFLSRFPAARHQNIKSAIIRFLNPKNNEVRNLVLRKLNAYFFLEAANLPSEAINKICSMSKKQVTYKVFVDSNFLFSILGMHENPSNEAAQSLIDIIKKVSNKVIIKLYITPLTVDEVRKVFIYQEQILKNLRITRSLARAASNNTHNGFAKKFFDECYNTGKSITAEDYFAPYLNDLKTIVRTKNVEVCEDKRLNNYSTDQRVIDDINDQMAYEEKTFTDRKLRKSYEILNHDICLWHIANDLRPNIIESPTDTTYYVVTIDFRLINYDAYKRRKLKRNNNIPVCVHPTNLIQVLQLWVPRDAEFEAAILNNLRFPFLFTDFDIETEKTTLRIIETLSRYENIEDLPDETVTTVLFNQALRQKISKTENKTEQLTFVKETLIEVNKKAHQKTEIAVSRANQLSQELSGKTETIKNLEGQLQNLHEQHGKSYLEKSLESKKAIFAEVNQSISTLENIQTKLLDIAETRFKNHKWYLSIPAVAYFVVLCVLIFKLTWNVMEPFIYIFSLLGVVANYLYFAITGESIDPRKYFEKKKVIITNQVYSDFSFDNEHLNKQRLRKTKLESEISELTKRTML